MIRLTDLTRTYRRPLFAPLTAELTGVVALGGPNGSGKTTLLRMCATLLRPTTGRIQVHGADTVDEAQAAREHLLYVPQEAPVLRLTAREHLAFTLGLRGVEVDLDAVLDDCGLARQAGTDATRLSRGERQRLHLGAAFASGAPVLLLDEPFANLDAAGQAWLHERLDAHTGTALVADHGHLRPALGLEAP